MLSRSASTISPGLAVQRFEGAEEFIAAGARHVATFQGERRRAPRDRAELDDLHLLQPREIQTLAGDGSIRRFIVFSHEAEVIMRARYDVHRDELTDALSGGASGIDGRLNGRHIAEELDRHEPGIGALGAEEPNIRRFGSRVGRLDGADEAPRLDQT